MIYQPQSPGQLWYPPMVPVFCGQPRPITLPTPALSMNDDIAIPAPNPFDETVDKLLDPHVEPVDAFVGCTGTVYPTAEQAAQESQYRDFEAWYTGESCGSFQGLSGVAANEAYQWLIEHQLIVQSIYSGLSKHR